MDDSKHVAQREDRPHVVQYAHVVLQRHAAQL